MLSPLHSSLPPSGQLEPELDRKYSALRTMLSGFNSTVTAFSGGVDSGLVAYLAHQALGAKALAVTSASESLSRSDLALTRQLADQWAMAHHIIRTRETENPAYLANPVDRCYYCKSTLYSDLTAVAREEGFETILNGTNVDDLGDHRPGLRAAEEAGVRAPLSECGMTKADIRQLAAHLGLSNADKPQAACLSSRVPYGLAISIPMLNQIEKAEAVLKRLGFAQLRVRHHGDVARIEVPAEAFEQVIACREELTREIRAVGYRFVTLDLEGFRSGSLNEGMHTDKK